MSTHRPAGGQLGRGITHKAGAVRRTGFTITNTRECSRYG